MSTADNSKLTDEFVARDREWRHCANNSKALRSPARTSPEVLKPDNNVIDASPLFGKSRSNDGREREDIADEWDDAAISVIKELLAIPPQSWGDLISQIEGYVEWTGGRQDFEVQSEFVKRLVADIRRLLEAE